MKSRLQELTNNSKSLTVICSTYNAERFLPKYLHSINAQTLKEFEIVFVESGSTDQSLVALESYNPRKGITKKLIKHQSRIGVYRAWNEAIQQSSGDWIINYNCDDYLFPHALETLLIYAEQQTEPCITYSDCLLSTTPDHNEIKLPSPWRNANKRENLLAGCCCGPFPLISKKLLELHGLFSEEFKHSGDYEMWCRLSANHCKFIKVELPLGIYYANPEGLSTSPLNQERRKLEDILAKRELIRGEKEGINRRDNL